MPTIRLDIALYWLTITVLLAGLFFCKYEINTLKKEVRHANNIRPEPTIVIDESIVPPKTPKLGK